MKKSPSRKSAEIAALSYAAEVLSDVGSHDQAFSDCEFTAEEEGIAYEFLAKIAQELQRRSCDIELGIEPEASEPKRKSSKPDKNEAKAAARRRGFYLNEEHDIFRPVCITVQDALAEGYITPEIVQQLAIRLESLPGGAVFPVREFIAGLKMAVDNWSSEVENKILQVAAQLFLNNYDWWGVFNDQDSIFGNWQATLFDAYQPGDDMTDKLFNFTGAFDGMSRSRCYDLSRELGGCPTTIARMTDYCIIADASVKAKEVSNTMMSAIASRARYGHLKLYTETDFKRLLDEHLPAAT